MTFQPGYPWAIVWPAHPTNWYDPANHGGVPNRPRAWCLHTPEEPDGDNYPGTPIWFAGPNRGGSTHYFVEDMPDPNHPGYSKVYQCVPESFGAIANGKTSDKPWPSWADRTTSLNWQTLSIEIEGKAATIHLTMSPMQLRTVAHLMVNRAMALRFDLGNTIGHYQVSSQRSDPGPLFPWAKLQAEIGALIGAPQPPPTEEDDDMFHRHLGLAHDAYFRGLTITEPRSIWTTGSYAPGDWDLPPEAKSMLVSVYLREGGADLADGGANAPGAKAGWCGWASGIPYTYRVYRGQDEHRSIWLNPAGHAVIEQIEVLGWYPS